MQIIKLDTRNPKHVDQFIRLPFDLYRNDLNWVPSMISEEKKLLDATAHPFYRHSTAAFFMVKRGKETIGRIGIANNHNYNAYAGTRSAFFNLFEVQDDRKAALALLDAASEWAKSQDLETVLGPKGFLHFGGRGLQIQGFEYLPAIGIAHNPPYYQGLLEAAGFTKHSDYVSGHLRSEDGLPERIHRIADRVKEKRGLWIKEFKKKSEMRAWVPRIRDLYNGSFVDVPLFYPITSEEMELVAGELLALTFPGLVKLIMKENDLIGFLLAYPNIGRGLQRARGKIWPVGWWHLTRERKRTEWVDVNGIGLLPEHQGVGANAILYSELEKTVRGMGYKHANLVQINDLNQKSMRELEHVGLVFSVRHRLYTRPL